VKIQLCLSIRKWKIKTFFGHGDPRLNWGEDPWLGLTIFDMTREFDTNTTRSYRVWVQVINELTRLWHVYKQVKRANSFVTQLAKQVDPPNPFSYFGGDPLLRCGSGGNLRPAVGVEVKPPARLGLAWLGRGSRGDPQLWPSRPMTICGSLGTIFCFLKNLMQTF